MNNRINSNSEKTKNSVHKQDVIHDVLIVDDEPHARRHIKNLISKDANLLEVYV